MSPGQQPVLSGELENKRPLSVKEQQQIIQAKIHALADCSVGKHTWQAAKKKGEQICTICNILAYCPVCVPHLARNARIAYCSDHQEDKV